MAATFWTRQGKTFYYARDRLKCVTLNLKNHQYKKVVFQVKNKEFVALHLKEAIEPHRNDPHRKMKGPDLSPW